MILETLLIFAGLATGLVADIIWWRTPRLHASSKFESHEHYHISLELLIIAIIIAPLNPTVPFILIGLAIAFFLGEWDQLKEIKRDGTVQPGHPFAHGSTHFTKSTAIGTALAITTVITYYCSLNLLTA